MKLLLGLGPLLLTLALPLPLRAQQSPSHEFYPTHVGDTWSYDSSVRGAFVNTVVDSAAAGGTVSYRVRSTDAAGRMQHYHIRHLDGRVLLTPPGGEEHLFIDFSVPLNDSFTVEHGQAAGRVTYRAYHESIHLLGAEHRAVREYLHHAPGGRGFSSYYARGIGLVAMVWVDPGTTVRLRRAEVAGMAVVCGDDSGLR
jgi:hypothetical protein